MPARLNGLVMIVNTLLPAILLIAVAAVFLAYKGEVARGWQDARQSLEAIRDSAQGTIDKVDSAATRAANKLEAAMAGLEAVGGRFEKISQDANTALAPLDKLRVPKFSVGWDDKEKCVDTKLFGDKCIKWREPSVGTEWSNIGAAVKKPFTDAFDAMSAAAKPLGDLKAAAAELAVLKTLPQEAEKAQAQLAVVADRALAVAAPIGRILTVAGYIAVFLTLWLGFVYGLRGYSRLIEGWTLMTGGSPG